MLVIHQPQRSQYNLLTPMTQIPETNKRKKKHVKSDICRAPAREEMFENAMETTMKKIAEMNEESEKRYIELEEKWLKMNNVCRK